MKKQKRLLKIAKEIAAINRDIAQGKNIISNEEKLQEIQDSLTEDELDFIENYIISN